MIYRISIGFTLIVLLIVYLIHSLSDRKQVTPETTVQINQPANIYTNSFESLEAERDSLDALHSNTTGGRNSQFSGQTSNQFNDRSFILEPFDQSKAILRNDPNDPRELQPGAETLSKPGLSEYTYTQAVHSLLDDYAIIVKDGGYPTGLNVEITNALLGKNRQKIALLHQDHPRINSEGELVDQWNNPYSFHLHALTSVTIRSAGMDGRLYTDDDITYSRTDAANGF